MTNFEKITQNPDTLAAFLGSLPVLSGPWDDAFQARYCAECTKTECESGGGCPYQKRRNDPGWWLSLEAPNDSDASAGARESKGRATLDKWLLSIPAETMIEQIIKQGCPDCPARDYCEASSLRCCKEVLYAWAAEEP